jgi:TrpR-related protein YerC/YecD
MKKELHHSGSEAFYETVLKLEDVDECRSFFEDICSARELQTIEQRFLLFYLLARGDSYSEIEEETGASSATISRASRQMADSHCNIADIVRRQFG